MKKINFFAVILLTAIFAGSVFAQTTSKVSVINPDAFEDEKTGIKKLVNAILTVNKEFEFQQKDLNALQEKINVVAKDGQAMQKAAEANPSGPIGAAQIQSKLDEFERLQTEFKRKREDLGAAYSKRYAVVVNPIYGEIQKAFTDFVKQQGISVLLDARPFARTQENPDGITIFSYVDPKADVTNDFIAFCNTRFATPASGTPATKPPVKP